jgi:hypothetical protein
MVLTNVQHGVTGFQILQAYMRIITDIHLYTRILNGDNYWAAKYS